MRKGVFFSIETMYLLVAVFVVMIGMIHFLPTVETPDYDYISTLKVAHDMGHNNTDRPPETFGGQPHYRFGGVCSSSEVSVELSYYDYDGAGNKEVCPI